jgi:hypothetical protein
LIGCRLTMIRPLACTHRRAAMDPAGRGGGGPGSGGPGRRSAAKSQVPASGPLARPPPVTAGQVDDLEHYADAAPDVVPGDTSGADRTRPHGDRV